MKKKDKGKLPPFVPLLKATVDAPAWKAMSHGARSLFVALKRRYRSDVHNNGRIYLSQRDAAIEIGSDKKEVGQWFRELQHYGFITMTQPGALGLDGHGKAPHWRLTEVGYMRDPPTQDFLRWNGVRFSKHRPGGDLQAKTKSRGGKHRQAGGEKGDTRGGEKGDTQWNKWGGIPPHTDDRPGGEKGDISSIPLPGSLSSLPEHPSKPASERAPKSAEASDAGGQPEKNLPLDSTVTVAARPPRQRPPKRRSAAQARAEIFRALPLPPEMMTLSQIADAVGLHPRVCKIFLAELHKAGKVAWPQRAGYVRTAS